MRRQGKFNRPKRNINNNTGTITLYDTLKILNHGYIFCIIYKFMVSTVLIQTLPHINMQNKKINSLSRISQLLFLLS